MSRTPLFVALLLFGPLLAGCFEAGPTPSGWARDPETGIEWRLLTEDERAQWGLEDHALVYVSRAPGVIEALREKDEVRFQVRAYGGIVDAALSFEKEEHYRVEGDDPRDRTTRWFTPEDPWSHARLTLPGAFAMEGSVGDFPHRVTTPFREWTPIGDIRSDDLVTRVDAACEQWGSAGHNETAACVRYRQPEGS